MKIGIFIGRLQPLHNAHLHIINKSLKETDKTIIILGSASQARTIKNPWTSHDRIKMIRDSLPIKSNDKLYILPVKDYIYNDNVWLANVQASLSEFDHPDNEYILYGYNKDKSSYYLKMFPKWKFVDVGNQGDINATNIRELIFSNKTFDEYCPTSVVNFINKEDHRGKYNNLKEEFKYISEYKSLWDKSPFPPTFVTTDAVVIKSGHILVVRRRMAPGKGLLALPGGFLGKDETLLDGCLRELKEETRIGLPKDEIRKRMVDSGVFDHPDRSLRGRTITHAYCFNLGSGELPKVIGSDDADKAWWISFTDAMKQEEEFFEDHYHIISYFLNKF